jgi:hypothetical protein
VSVENLYSVTGEAISDEQCGGRVLVWMRPSAAIVTVIEVGNALKADIERPLLKCREVPVRDVACAIQMTNIITSEGRAWTASPRSGDGR